MAVIGNYNGVAALAVVTLVALTGCGTSAIAPCIDDSTQCISQRKDHYQQMTTDTSREWIKRPPSAEMYATGTRLFAYRSSRLAMSCPELAIGIGETGSAREILRSASSTGINAQRQGEIIALSDDVNIELKSERARRCGG